MPGVSGVTVVTMLVCSFISHTRLRAQRAPGIPCALSRAKMMYNSGGRRREVVKVCLLVIARSKATKQSTILLLHRWIASLTLAMTV